MPSRSSFDADVIVVGAGSAGCALAGRLACDTDLKILLLEAGAPSRNPWLHIPIGIFKTVGHPAHDWGFQTEPDPAMADRRLPWPRGKGLGGSSLINGMLYLRGHRQDYEQWAALGNPGWDWASVEPYFKRSSRLESATPPIDAPPGCLDGPLSLAQIPPDPLSDAFIAAAGRCGIARTQDFNGGDNAGAGYFQMTLGGGRRMSSARAYLDRARHRPNLTVLSRAHALEVLVEGGRAAGVKVHHEGQLRTLRARHEVVLSAGSIQSPQLLELSGIGDASRLAPLGLKVNADLPGVGNNLQDHLQVRPSYRCQGVETLNDIARSPWRGAREFLRYVTTRSGALRDGVYRAGAFLGLDESTRHWPDVQIHFGLVSFDRIDQPPHPFPGITLSACLLRPESRGSVHIDSLDPLQAPRIRSGYLSAERDRHTAVAMLRKMREIAASDPLARYIVSEHDPGPALQTQEDLLQWVRRKGGSIFHPVGSCAMGPAPERGAVVDARLRVHGIEGLRVADGSVMPRIVSGNTNGPIIMIGEKAADLIKEDLLA